MPDPGSTSAFYAAQPSVQLDGTDAPNLSNGLLSLMVEETTAGLYRCEATFGNWGNYQGTVGYLYFDRQVLDFGKSFAVRAGDGAAAAKIFDGRITGLEAQFPQNRPPQIIVLAEDRFQDLRMTRRTRSLEDVSDSDALRQIAGQHGLSADLDMPGPTHKVLTQLNQSDLAFIRERATAVDAEVWLEGSTLHAKQRAGRHAGDVTMTYGQGLLEISVLADVAQQRTSLVVSGWDVSAKEAIEHEAAEDTIRPELNGHDSGANILQSAFGRRAERVVHLAPQNEAEARALALAQFRRHARRFVTAHGVAEGDARIRVGTRLQLQALGSLFDGAYSVVETRHVFDRRTGYRTHFKVERPGIGRS